MKIGVDTLISDQVDIKASKRPYQKPKGKLNNDKSSIHLKYLYFDIFCKIDLKYMMQSFMET